MEGNQYIKGVLRTASDKRYPVDEQLDHAADGMVTEAGEFKDVLKKAKYYGRVIDYVNLVEELGDLLWYIGLAMSRLDVTFEEVWEQNLAKLKARYPEKFTEDAANKRDLDNERKVLQQTMPQQKSVATGALMDKDVLAKAMLVGMISKKLHELHTTGGHTEKDLQRRINAHGNVFQYLWNNQQEALTLPLELLRSISAKLGGL